DGGGFREAEAGAGLLAFGPALSAPRRGRPLSGAGPCLPSAGPAPCRGAAATTGSTAATAAVPLVVGKPGRRLLGDPEAPDLLDRRHLPGGQRHDAERVARCARGLSAATSAARLRARLA